MGESEKEIMYQKRYEGCGFSELLKDALGLNRKNKPVSDQDTTLSSSLSMDITTPSVETTTENTDIGVSQNKSTENNGEETFDYDNQLNQQDTNNDVFTRVNESDSDLFQGDNGDDDINVDSDLEKRLLNSETC